MHVSRNNSACCRCPSGCGAECVSMGSTMAVYGEHVGMSDKLQQVRTEIDEIDQQLIKLLESRLMLAEQVARIKERDDGVAMTDPKRERAIIERLQQSTEHKVLQSEVENIFSICMKMSKRVRIIRHQQEKNKYLPALKLGVIGHGHFGSLLSHTFNTYWRQCEIMVYAPEKQPDLQSYFPFEQVCQADWLFLCVPISQMTEILQQIKPYLSEETTVIDVCSVKVYAVEQMRSILGDDVRMIASHPMFGPQSTKQGTDYYGLNLVAYNMSAPAFVYDVFVQFWKNMGVQVVELTPEEHDRYAAYSINYNHLMGRIGEAIGIQSTPIDTQGFRVIYDALQYVTSDTWELFRDMQVSNPFANEMREKVLHAVQHIESRLHPDQSIESRPHPDDLTGS